VDSQLTASTIAVRDCMGVKSDETVLIISDEPLREIGYSLWEVSKQYAKDAIYSEIVPRNSNGQEPPKEVAEFMKIFDVVLIPTSKSLSHTDSRRNASKLGARIATLPGITEDTMIRTLNADYIEIAKKSSILADLITRSSKIRITSDNGTDITMLTDGRKGHPDTGLNHSPGDFSNLPAGEAYVAPLEGTSTGKVVIDGSMAGIGLLGNQQIIIEVDQGFATKITGGSQAQRLFSLMEPFGKLAFNLAELGIGTNEKAKVIGNVLEDEKAIGTIHVAFGDNKSMGGVIRVASHLDGVILYPTVYFDNVTIMNEGKFLIF